MHSSIWMLFQEKRHGLKCKRIVFWTRKDIVMSHHFLPSLVATFHVIKFKPFGSENVPFQTFYFCCDHFCLD